METSINAIIRKCLARIDKEYVYVLNREHFLQFPADDLHKNYSGGYVTTLSSGGILPLDSIENYGQTFRLDCLRFREERGSSGEMDSFGLYCDEAGEFLDEFLDNLCRFDFEQSDFPEYRHFTWILSLLALQYFAYSATTALILPCYMALLAEGKIPVNQDSFRLCAMVDLSQAMDTVEALPNFRLKADGAQIRLYFGENDLSLRDTYLDLMSRESFRKWLETKYDSNLIDRINADISVILSHM